MTDDAAADAARPLRAGVLVALISVPVAVLAWSSLRGDDEAEGFWAVFLIPLAVPFLWLASGFVLRRLEARLPFLGGLLVALAYPVLLFGTAGSTPAGAALAWPLAFGAVALVWSAVARPRPQAASGAGRVSR